jgi:hypothetical protein
MGKGNHTGKGGFIKGKSGNPKGRPLGGAALSEAIRRFLEMEREEFVNYKFRYIKEAVAWNLINSALKQEPAAIQAIRELFDRTEGKAVQKQVLVGEEGAAGILIEFTGNGQGPFQTDSKAKPGDAGDAGPDA